MASHIYQTRAKLIKNIEVAENYYKIVLSCPQVAQKAQPGQFLQIKVNDGDEPLLRRPFSIHRIVQSPKSKVQSPRGYDRIEILYEVLGEATEILSKKKPGEHLDIMGPLGQGFDYSAPVLQCCSAPVLVAGGMGVAPLIFLAEKLTELKTQNSKFKTIVLIGAKTRNQILCEKELKRLGCEVKIATDDGSRGFKGKVTDLLKKILCNTQYSIHNTIYACGPRLMLKEISRISQQYNIPAQVSLEEHMACGIGACFGCAVKTRYPIRNTQYGVQYKRVCKEGPVFDSDEIVWE